MSDNLSGCGGTDFPNNIQPAVRKRGRPAHGAVDERVDRREDIIKASSELFFHEGYAETTLRRVAADAQVNVALIHYYFTNKQGLYLEVLTGAMNDTLSSLKQYQNGLPTLYHLIHVLTDPFLADKALARTLLLPKGPVDALDMIAKVRRRIRHLLLATLQTMHRMGRLPRDLDTDLLTSTFLDLCWGPIRGHLEQAGDETIFNTPTVECQIEQNTKVLQAAIALPGAT